MTARKGAGSREFRAGGGVGGPQPSPPPHTHGDGHSQHHPPRGMARVSCDLTAEPAAASPHAPGRPRQQTSGSRERREEAAARGAPGSRQLISLRHPGDVRAVSRLLHGGCGHVPAARTASPPVAVPTAQGHHGERADPRDSPRGAGSPWGARGGRAGPSARASSEHSEPVLPAIPGAVRGAEGAPGLGPSLGRSTTGEWSVRSDHCCYERQRWAQ